MADLVFTNAQVTFGTYSSSSTDLSDHVKSVTLNFNNELHDNTAMGDSSRSKKSGLKNWDVTIEFYQDYAASKIDATMWALVNSSSTSLDHINILPVNTSVAATNPRYHGDIYVENYTPVNANIGEMGTVSVTIPGTGDLTRAVA